MLDLRATIKRFVYQGDGGFAIALLDVDETLPGSDEPPAWVVGRTPCPAKGPTLGLCQVGEGVRIRAQVERHPQHGEQLAIEHLEALGVTTPRQAERWLERLDGVGPRLAERIADALGPRIVAVLTDAPEPDPLLDVRGITAAKALRIRESFAELGQAGDLEALQYLDGLGLTRYEAAGVIQHAKRRKTTPRDLLERDPYDMIEAKGWGFKRTDAVALRAGASRECPARIDAGLRAVLAEATEAHTLIGYGDLLGQARALLALNDPAPIFDGIARRNGGDWWVLDTPHGRLVTPDNLLRAERAVCRYVKRAKQHNGSPARLSSGERGRQIATGGVQAGRRAEGFDPGTPPSHAEQHDQRAVVPSPSHAPPAGPLVTPEQIEAAQRRAAERAEQDKARAKPGASKRTEVWM